MECDICGGSNTPRNPYWRDNLTKTCDPCQAKIDAKLGEARPTPVEPEARHLPACQLCGSPPANEAHAVETQRRWIALTHPRVAVEPDGLPLDVDERNWLAGEGTIAAAMGGERLMARNPIVKAAYDRGRSDGVLFGTPSEAKP